ncbi:hypothetical protein N8311_01305 [bacterium]|nr:hypothetical protein [bacterium]
MEKILISTIVWGDEYFQKLITYNLPSLLFSEKIIDKSFNIEVHILTSEKLKSQFKTWIGNQKHSYLYQFKVLTFESLGVKPNLIPDALDTEKYNFLSKFQNLFFKVSINFDLHIINYPDFFWSNNSFKSIVKLLKKNDIAALLGFVVPVNEFSFLEKINKKYHYPYSINNDDLVLCALDNLHKEVLIRNWEKDRISKYPSYLIMKLQKKGILIKTFHKHIIAMKPSLCSPILKQGIQNGTIDNYYVSYLEDSVKTKTLHNTKNFSFVSLHNTEASSLSMGFKTKETVLKEFISNQCNSSQLKAFQKSIEFSVNPEKNIYNLVEEKEFCNSLVKVISSKYFLTNNHTNKNIKNKHKVIMFFKKKNNRLKIKLKNIIIKFFY